MDRPKNIGRHPGQVSLRLCNRRKKLDPGPSLVSSFYKENKLDPASTREAKGPRFVRDDAFQIESGAPNNLSHT